MEFLPGNLVEMLPPRFSLGAKFLITSVRPKGKLKKATKYHLSSLAFLTLESRLWLDLVKEGFPKVN
jgi:hypothetical protein